MPQPLKAVRVKENTLRIQLIYGVTVFEDFLRAEPEKQKEILRRDMQQAALDVINDTDFKDIQITEDLMGKEGE